jgi:hypothetical protein
VSRVYPWLSILMALALALFEWVFFFQGANWEGPSGPFAPDRLGFNLSWVTLIYLSFQLLTIPLAAGSRDRFIGVLDGMASVVPLGSCTKSQIACTSVHPFRTCPKRDQATSERRSVSQRRLPSR